MVGAPARLHCHLCPYAAIFRGWCALMRSRRFLVLLFAIWLCAMTGALWSLEYERLIFAFFCTVPAP